MKQIWTGSAQRPNFLSFICSGYFNLYFGHEAAENPNAPSHKTGKLLFTVHKLTIQKSSTFNNLKKETFVTNDQ